jgi:phospholipase C
MLKRVLVLALGVGAIGVGLATTHGCGSSPEGSPDGGGDSGTSDSSLMDAPAKGGEGGMSDTGSDAADGGQLEAARAAIKHIVIINQENRSFDTYFGTFPGADGIPMDGGVPTVCNVNPDGGACQAPYHEMHDENYGGPHGNPAFVTCVADGGMGGFIQSASKGKDCDAGFIDPGCKPSSIDVMGYHDDREIPNYWAYAKNFVLQDHMFEPVDAYSLPDHLYMVSGWSATCTPANDPTHCISDVANPGNGGDLGGGGGKKKAPLPEYAWTDITYLLHAKSVSWNYFVAGGMGPDCEDGETFCKAAAQHYLKPSFWNVLPWFDSVKEDDEVANVQDTNNFYKDVQAGSLASVTWLIPSGALSEHPPNLVSRGQAYVTEIINAIMKSPLWDSTVIFLTWDDWGGFYDHMNPLPDKVDANGYGLRVPGMTISPWVKPGQIDKQLLSHDAYLKFIEDIFLDGQRLDPATDGRKDSRPTVREDVPVLGDLLSEFDFSQKANAPLVLDACPAGVDTIYSKAGPCVP